MSEDKTEQRQNSPAVKVCVSEDETTRGSVDVAPRLSQADIFLHGQELTLSQQCLCKQESVLRVRRPADVSVKCHSVCEFSVDSISY